MQKLGYFHPYLIVSNTQLFKKIYDSCILKLMIVREATVDKSVIFAIDRFLPVVAFAIPFFISGPQLLTGSLVNCFLFLTSIYSSKKSQIAVIILPSIGALLNGLLFGKFTPFLAYFLPFIWIGNFILVKSFTRFVRHSGEGRNPDWIPTFVGMTLATLLKSSFLFIFAFVFFKLQIVPQIFLTAMGIFQLITAVIGGVLFLGINKIFVGINK